MFLPQSFSTLCPEPGFSLSSWDPDLVPPWWFLMYATMLGFMWVLGVRIEVLLLAWQALYPLNYHPSLKLYLLIGTKT